MAAWIRPCQAFVHNDHVGSGFPVLVSEGTAQNGNAHGLEITGRYGYAQGRNQGLARLHLVAFGKNDAVIVIVAEGNRVRGAYL